MGCGFFVFIVEGLLARGRPRVASGEEKETGRREDAEAAARRQLQSLCDSSGAPEEDQGGGQDEEDDDQEDEDMREAKKGAARLDWGTYRAVFDDTPLHAAVTAMFAEYSLLVGRMTRRLGAAAVTPMTMSEGAAMAEQAQIFILQYVTPILGTVGTTKVHRLLCHIMHAAR